MKRLVQILFLIICCGILAQSCKRIPETQFSRNQVLFTQPAGWKLQIEEFSPNLSESYTIEKAGFTASGVKIITWFAVDEESLTRDKVLEDFQETLETSLVHRKTIEFSEPLDVSYGSYEARSVTFSFSLLGIEHEGQIWTLEACDRLFQILQQGAIEDRKANNRGFDLIRTSFKCNYPLS